VYHEEYVGSDGASLVLNVPCAEWVTSDLHLGHYNIIEYCNRPFKSLEEMDEVLIRNWNNWILPRDKVFYLGDLARRNQGQYLSRLKGRIVRVNGNHDGAPGHRWLIVKGYDVAAALIHNPADAYEITEPYDWLVHGHVHNNAPFLDVERRRINVSVDVTDFKPVPLDYVLRALSYYKHTGGDLSLRDLKETYGREEKRPPTKN
jgi:calcineurin-like phosphoesterase family protein